jgi:hypothetical protein
MCDMINATQSPLSQFSDQEQYYLLRDGSHVCWPPANEEQFLAAAIKLWNQW